MAFLKTLNGARKGTTSKGISQLKKYLSYLGYLNHNNNTTPTHNQTNDFFDDNLELAIKHYQTFFKVTVNGIMDPNTVEKMASPLCGVPDVNLNTSNKLYLQIPTLASHYAFYPGYKLKSHPTMRNLTYSFPRGTRSDVYQAILHATQIWTIMSPFRFSYIENYYNADIKISFHYRDHGDDGVLAHAFAPTTMMEMRGRWMVKDQSTRADASVPFALAFGKWMIVSRFKFRGIDDFGSADVKVSFERRDHGDGSPFDGPYGVVAHSFYPPDGRLHFDADESWTPYVAKGSFDLLTVALHEVGHILGLGHSPNPKASMFAYFEPGKPRDLNDDDIRGIQALYPN
ncbi:Metalloendoproteinase 2-MMP [Sesamum alatum]|uniref:Metalloendoproteinase 2-MMP n=1 Tax=Sesamum alatum TaxID=300844 RepID=A0AAE1XX77_9LAMI|nr:Metalloendoproteinase 2-MMP [Sesamum alatum]